MAQQLTELQEKWLQALESGEYEQAKGVLHDGKGYCCLGVACVVAGLRGDVLEGDQDAGEADRYEFDGESEGAPDSIVKQFNLIGGLGEFKNGIRLDVGGKSVADLANANDKGATFAEIAAAIRANPENFFLPPEAQS